MSKIEELIAIMARLRDPQQGCPWDREQDFHSLIPHTLEEAYELADAIEREGAAAICGELGDLLFQVVFYARIAEEQGTFDFETVADGIVGKLVRRHPHVFGDAHMPDAQAQTQAWEAHKAEERRRETGSIGTLSGVALALPALTRAAKLQRRAVRVGFDWPSVLPVFDKIAEELEEVRHEINQNAGHDRIEDEIGDLLFAVTNLARHAEVDPEAALRRANHKFERRFRAMEAKLARAEQSMSSLNIDAWEALWQSVKQDESHNARDDSHNSKSLDI